jgi:xylulokinase
LRNVSEDPSAHLRRPLEDLSFVARDLFSQFDRAGVPPGPIYTTGGWSRSRALVELRASVFGRPIFVAGDLELTATGAACFGAEAAESAIELPAALRKAPVVEPVAEWAAAYEALAASRA